MTEFSSNPNEGLEEKFTCYYCSKMNDLSKIPAHALSKKICGCGRIKLAVGMSWCYNNKRFRSGTEDPETLNETSPLKLLVF